MFKLLTFICLFWLCCVELAFSQNASEEQEIITVVEQLFEGMYQADSAAVAELLLEGGTIVSRRISDSGEPQLTFTTNRSFSERIGTWEEESVRERFWDARTMIDDGLAMVWTPYDLHVDGAFSHCGIDLFSLVDTSDGWKVATITYTVKEKPCDAPAMDSE